MFKGIKLYIVVIVAVSLLSVLLLGLRVYTQYQSNNLEGRIKSIGGVKSVSIVRDKVSEKIFVDIDKSADLQEIYLDVEREVNRDTPQAEIIIQDIKGHDYKKVKEAFDIISFDIFESKVNGDFKEMRDDIQVDLAMTGVSYTLRIDEDNIYLTLLYGDSALYRIINYSEAARGNLR